MGSPFELFGQCAPVYLSASATIINCALFPRQSARSTNLTIDPPTVGACDKPARARLQKIEAHDDSPGGLHVGVRLFLSSGERLGVNTFTEGASLLAIAVVQSTSMLDVMQSSRAGSLPQGGMADQAFFAAWLDDFYSAE